MNCAGCGFELQSGFAFCPRCGRRQPLPCAACGYACAPDFSFCPKCGSRVGGEAATEQSPVQAPKPSAKAVTPVLPRPDADRPDGDADRRTVTVLFADLSGFTALSERFDPEIMQTLQNQLFEELTDAVQAFGGFVDKFLGDALLALFGAPAAHEDDPERALRAALDMMRRATRVGERLDVAADIPLRLHIGINTGQVVTGGIGAGDAKSYSVTGDTVNIAQRLQGLAAPGEVLVGPLTHRLTRHAFSYAALGDVALRGKAGQVAVHRLLAPLAAPRAARGLEALGLGAALVGRDAELSRLLETLGMACDGAAQLVQLVGEAGIGKSRLVGEFVARINDDERFEAVAVRQAACSPLGEQSYGALAAILRSAYGIGHQDSAEETRTKLAAALTDLGIAQDEAARMTPLFLHILGLGDPTGALRHVEPDQLRRQILHAIRTIFERRLELSPLLIIVEDLHWADAVSIEALRFVMDRLERRRLMLLVTHRPTPDMEQLDSGRISHSTLRLAPLGTDVSGALVDALLGRSRNSSSAGLRRRILERAGGNPLFIEEIVRSLVEEGVIVRDGPAWRVTADEATAAIPASIETMLLARVDRLPQAVRKLAQRAAVIGPRFDAGLLAAVSPDTADVEFGLDLLCDAEVIEESEGAGPVWTRSYRFTQTMLQDVIYQNLLRQRRTELHERIAAALERICGEDPARLDDLTRLGHHFSHGVSKAKGASYLAAAGDRARAVHANDDALRLFNQALRVLPEGGAHRSQRLALCERIADLCGPAGKRDAAHDHYRSVLEALTADGDRAGAARVIRKIGRLLWDAGKRDQAAARYAEAATLLEGMNAPIEQARLLQERGRLAFRLGDHGAAALYAKQALDFVQSLPADAPPEIQLEAEGARAEALNTRGAALARLGRAEEALRDVEESVAVAETAGLLRAACRGYTNLGVLYSVIDPAKAIDVCRRGLDVARRIGDLGIQARLLANLAVASCTFTDRCADEGAPAAQQAIEIDRALDQREHLAVPLIALGQIHQCHGQPDLASRCYNEALDLARETGEPQLLVPCYDGLATLNLDLDELDEAERYFGLAQDVCAKHGIDPGSLVVLPFLD